MEFTSAFDQAAVQPLMNEPVKKRWTLSMSSSCTNISADYHRDYLALSSIDIDTQGYKDKSHSLQDVDQGNLELLQLLHQSAATKQSGDLEELEDINLSINHVIEKQQGILMIFNQQEQGGDHDVGGLESMAVESSHPQQGSSKGVFSIVELQGHRNTVELIQQQRCNRILAISAIVLGVLTTAHWFVSYIAQDNGEEQGGAPQGRFGNFPAVD